MSESPITTQEMINHLRTVASLQNYGSPDPLMSRLISILLSLDERLKIAEIYARANPKGHEGSDS